MGPRGWFVTLVSLCFTVGSILLMFWMLLCAVLYAQPTAANLAGGPSGWVATSWLLELLHAQLLQEKRDVRFAGHGSICSIVGVQTGKLRALNRNTSARLISMPVLMQLNSRAIVGEPTDVMD